MDKNIDPEVINRRKKKVIGIVLVSIVALVTAVFFLRASFASSIKRSSITTAEVQIGLVENTLDATGEVQPEFEEVITSPINGSIQEVLVEAGASVKAGKSILTLDKSISEAEFEKQKFLLATKQNDIKKLRLQLDKGFYDIKSNNSIKQLKIDDLIADVENTKRLYNAGGATREDIEKAALSLKVAQEEKLQLENEIKNKQLTMQVEMNEANLAAAIQQNELRALERKLKLANVIAARDGVVTWVNKNIGVAIHEGETLTRIANLSSFKVQGTISDNQLSDLRSGVRAIIRINDTLIKGSVTNVQPTIQNGVATFNVQLDERNHRLLRPNMKVEISLVTSTKNNALRVPNGPAFKGSATQDIFVINGNKAIRKTVNIGLTSFDFVEIIDNVKAGDIIITSDMSQYKNSKEITLSN